MRKKLKTISEGLAIIFLIMMTIKDFFPELPLNMPMLIVGFIFSILLAATSYSNKKQIFDSNRQRFVYTVVTSVCFILLILFLTLLGGQSKSGIGLENPVIWIGLLSSS